MAFRKVGQELVPYHPDHQIHHSWDSEHGASDIDHLFPHGQELVQGSVTDVFRTPTSGWRESRTGEGPAFVVVHAPPGAGLVRKSAEIWERMHRHYYRALEVVCGEENVDNSDREYLFEYMDRVAEARRGAFDRLMAGSKFPGGHRAAAATASVHRHSS